MENNMQLLIKYLKNKIRYTGVSTAGNTIKVNHMNFDIFDDKKFENIINSLQRIKK